MLIFLYSCTSPEISIEPDFAPSMPENETIPAPEVIDTEEPPKQVQENQSAAVEITPVIENEASAPEAVELFLPQLTYPQAYNGPLYATSEQIGDSAPLSHLQNLRRNGVNFMIAFFSIELDPAEEEDLDIMYAKQFTSMAPGRVVPFFSLGLPAEETKPLVGEQLTNRYRETLAAIQEQAGEDFIKGFGEIEQYAWNIQPNDPKMLQLFDLAAENNLAVMFHPAVGQSSEVKKVLERYSRTTFLIHMFPEDLSRDREQYINLLKTHQNLYFSVDVDHMMFDGQTGLLYKYEDDEVKTAARKFIANYDQNERNLLNTALERYRPLIEAVPDKVMWGTEGGTDYVYEPEVYDRMIKFTRLFIGELKPEVQEKFAYRNAEKLIEMSGGDK